jgi:outer membrane protein OmpA-like peptidoglycan-associated protein
VRIDPVQVPDVDIEPQRLQSVKLAGSDDVRQLRGGSVTSFVAPARVLFDTDSAELRTAAVPSLRAIARRITQQPSTSRVLVEGHTDDRGSASYGLDLSKRRAEAVASWLERLGGIDPARVRTRGLGERAPVVPNTSAANRQQNRRVVISLIG